MANTEKAAAAKQAAAEALAAKKAEAAAAKQVTKVSLSLLLALTMIWLHSKILSRVDV